MLEKAIKWIKTYTISNQGVAVTSKRQISYPEVTGYLIPALLSVGEHDLARQYAEWLVSAQKQDGSFYGAGDHCGYAFDTGQVIKGWNAMLDRLPRLEMPLRKACDWIMETADATTGRLLVPRTNTSWSLGRRGEVSEGIHLYVLPALRDTGEILNEPKYTRFANRSLDYYLNNSPLADFSQSNAMTHFFAYIQEALLELGCDDKALEGMVSVSEYQQPTGAIPAYSDVPWVCSTGMAQLALVWYRLGDSGRADSALSFLEKFQNPSGGFFGSYGVQAEYFPSEEISWAPKFIIDAIQQKIANHFDQTADHYRSDIAISDGRVQALLRHLGDLTDKNLLDAGCGKGRYSIFLKHCFPNANITALDISLEMLKDIPNAIKTVHHGLLNMPFPDHSFDSVICIEALEHVIQIEQGIQELTRVLAPGGKLVIIDKNHEKKGKLGVEPWEKWFEKDALLQFMKNNGLDALAEFIGYDQVLQPDGLFICWWGTKAQGASTFTQGFRGQGA
ncbi:MAG: methyltransferase domain-containing protein [Deltaproteobacteria bacterium]|nr:methyltransferase domain-containing protein [Deltaproteobacteria bacterium]